MAKETKKSKSLAYIIAVVVIVLILAVVYMQLNKPAVTPAAPTAPEEKPAVTPAAPTAPAPTEKPAVTAAGEIAYGSRGILSDVKCEGGKISAIVTNVQQETMSVKPKSATSDLIIQVNGNRMQDFTCDKESLGAEEYTSCSDLMGVMAAKLKDTGNEVAVWFKSDANNRGTVTVDCK